VWFCRRPVLSFLYHCKEAPSQMDAPPTNAANPAEPSPAKKAYEAPVLQQWGTLRDLTQSVSNKGGKDNFKNNRKTR
jgi:hypothetical protein